MRKMHFIGRLIFLLLFTFTIVACDQHTEQFDEKDESETTQADVEDTETGNEKSLDDAGTEEESESKDPEADTKKDTDVALDEELLVHYIDADQADATLFEYADKADTYTILYDTGDWNKNDVVNYLHAEGIEAIDLVIISHPHADHIGQLADVMHTFDVGEVWMTENESSSNTFQEAVTAVLESDADYAEPKAGETFDIGPMNIEVLHPEGLTGDLNEDSLSARFTYGGVSFMFTGDAYKEQELEMMRSADDVEADILQLGHHGSDTSSDPRFVEAVNPEVAIYSAGANNSYGHPSEEPISLLENAGITIYGTDVHGTIIVSSDGKAYDIQTKEDGTISPKSTKSEESHEQNADESTKESARITSECVDINIATVEELQDIIHIGPERAQDLVSQRPYDTVEDLAEVNGIGPARIDDIKAENNACVGGS